MSDQQNTSSREDHVSATTPNKFPAEQAVSQIAHSTPPPKESTPSEPSKRRKPNPKKSVKTVAMAEFSVTVEPLDLTKHYNARYWKSPWRARWLGEDGNEKTKQFPTEEAACEYRDALIASAEAGISIDQMREAARIAKGTSYTVPQLCLKGLEFLRLSETTAVNPAALLRNGADMTLAKAKRRRDKALENGRRKTKGDEAAAKRLRSYRRADNLVGRIESFIRRIFPADEHGDAIPGRGFNFKPATMITADEVAKFLSTLPNIRGETGKASGWTRFHFASTIYMFMLAVGAKSKDLKELINEEKRAAEENHTVEIFANDEVRKMFAAACDDEKAQLALAVIGGLRPELIEDLTPECINLRQGTITIPEHLAKDGNLHILKKEHRRPDGAVLEGLPPVLFEWLTKHPFVPHRADVFQERMKRALGGKWIADGLRHTAASNYHAYFGEAATAKFLTHAGEKLVFKHYVKPLTPEHADEFYSITPSQFKPRTREDVVSETKARWRAAGKTIVDWPADDILAKLVWTKPITKIAAELGCSDPSVHKHCRKRGISTPPVGHWQKVQFGRA